MKNKTSDVLHSVNFDGGVAPYEVARLFSIESVVPDDWFKGSMNVSVPFGVHMPYRFLHGKMFDQMVQVCPELLPLIANQIPFNTSKKKTNVSIVNTVTTDSADSTFSMSSNIHQVDHVDMSEHHVSSNVEMLKFKSHCLLKMETNVRLFECVSAEYGVGDNPPWTLNDQNTCKVNDGTCWENSKEKVLRIRPIISNSTSLYVSFGCLASDYEYESTITKDKPWVALVVRGGCSFRTKAMVAEAAGARSLIIAMSLRTLNVKSNEVSNSQEVNSSAIEMEEVLIPPNLGPCNSDTCNVHLNVVGVSHETATLLLQTGEEDVHHKASIVLIPTSVDLFKPRLRLDQDKDDGVTFLPIIEALLSGENLTFISKNAYDKRDEKVFNESLRPLQRSSLIEKVSDYIIECDGLGVKESNDLCLRSLTSFLPLSMHIEPYAIVSIPKQLITQFSSMVLPNLKFPIILLTFDSDLSMPNAYTQYYSNNDDDQEVKKCYPCCNLYILDHPKVAHWFSDNWICPLKERDSSNNDSDVIHSRASLSAPYMTSKQSLKVTLLPIGFSDRPQIEDVKGDLRPLLEAIKISVSKHIEIRKNIKSIDEVESDIFNSSLAREDNISSVVPDIIASFHHSGKSFNWNSPSSGELTAGERYEALFNLTLGNHGEMDAFIPCFKKKEMFIHFDLPRSLRDGWMYRAKMSETLDNLHDEVQWNQFELCPSGNSVDTHCIWEALALGLIPIVKKTPFSDILLASIGLSQYSQSMNCEIDTCSAASFADLLFPILVVNSWNKKDIFSAICSYPKKEVKKCRNGKKEAILSRKSQSRVKTLLRLTDSWWFDVIKGKQQQKLEL